MTLAHKSARGALRDQTREHTRREVAPALFQLLSDGALGRAALSACGFAVALADAQTPGRPLTYVNPAFEALFGFGAGEALGRPIAALLFAGEAAAQANRMFEEPERSRLLRARCRDGTLLDVDATLGGVRGADGRITHWVLAFTDRSELEKLREEVRRLTGERAHLA